jgi:hypothetical protein
LADPVKYYTHVNRGVIDSNRKHGTNEPAVSVRRGKTGKAWYAHEVELPAGSRMIYSAHKPLLQCGARLVIVSDSEPLKIV